MPGDRDGNWPSASRLLTDQDVPGRCNVALVGLPTYATSVTPRTPCETPSRVREALASYSTWSWREGVDLLEQVAVVDYGDVPQPDEPIGHDRARSLVGSLRGRYPLVTVLGGDNAATFLAATALAGEDLATWGLITLDAHLDLRDGESNGSPVRQLLEAGLPGRQVVQLGLADFSNSPAYATRARRAGVSTVTRTELLARPLRGALDEALATAASAGGPVYVDVDLDVADRSVVPACPGAAPGGLSAAELRLAVGHLARSPVVRAIDFVEVDSTRDTPDQRTVRLVALLLLEALAGAASPERAA